MPFAEPNAMIGITLAIVVSAAALVLLRTCSERLPLALPNARGLHSEPVPRIGGIAIWAGWLPIALGEPPAVSGRWALWLAGWAAVAAVSLGDDWMGVRVPVRLGTHALAAMLVAGAIASGAGDTPEQCATVAVIAAAVVLWGTNLYNFMDGSDGLATLMAITGFTAYAVAVGLSNRESWAAYAAIAAAALPFFAVNRPRASMFLGDVGAAPLGFLASAFAVDRVARGHWPAWFPALVFLPFLLDATLTLLRRLFAGEPVWLAHRSHYYQRLLQLGFGHGGTLAVYGALMVVCAATAVGCLIAAPGAGTPALVVLCVIHGVVFAAIDYHWAKQPDTR